jgi:hypothetical protein
MSAARLLLLLTACTSAACCSSSLSHANAREERTTSTTDSIPLRPATVNLSGAWATGSTGEPASPRVLLHVECNYTPSLWVLQQDGDTVRAWVIPESRAQGIPTTQHISAVGPVGRISGVDLEMRTAGTRLLLRYDSTSGHLRGTLNDAPFWAVRQEIVRPDNCIPIP